MGNFVQTGGGRPTIAFLSSWHWEGAYVLRKLLEANIPIDFLIIQNRWWKKFTIFGYSARYWLKYLLDRTTGLYQGKYETFQSLQRRYKLRTFRTRNINHELAGADDADRPKLFDSIKPDYIVVVGSRIIKERILARFPDRWINLHTGYLPHYRGPYSEFWAIYNNDRVHIGATIHLLDQGIDTGRLLRRATLAKAPETPEECHRQTVDLAANMMIKVLTDLATVSLQPIFQEESQAAYYSYPSDEQIRSVEQRLRKRININFGE